MKTPAQVLLVDDIPEYLDTLELSLPKGCVALRAESVEEARQLIIDQSPALAVIDVRLKEMDESNRGGLELLQWIRGTHPQLPVIMISAYREFEFEAESLALGAELFLRKPVQPDEFQVAVTKVLEQAH